MAEFTACFCELDSSERNPLKVGIGGGRLRTSQLDQPGSAQSPYLHLFNAMLAWRSPYNG